MAKQRNYKAEYAKRKARRVIKEREAKRGKPLSAAYKKRIEKALAKGKTLQQARGHKKAEHIERKVREITEYGLTKQQTRTVFNWAEKVSFRHSENLITGPEAVAWAAQAGYERFKEYRSRFEEIEKQYYAMSRKGRYESFGMGFMQALENSLDLPELSWLYYH